MRAIARSDGSRASVIDEIRGGAVRNGVLGDFRFNRGDIAPVAVPIFRVTGRSPADEKTFDLFDGAVIDHVFENVRVITTFSLVATSSMPASASPTKPWRGLSWEILPIPLEP
jgi:hypothetical protein